MDAQKQNEPLENKVAGESFAGKESVADDKKRENHFNFEDLIKKIRD